MQPKRNWCHLQPIQTYDEPIPTGQPEPLKNHRPFPTRQEFLRINQEPLNDVQGHERGVERVQYIFHHILIDTMFAQQSAMMGQEFSTSMLQQ